MFGNKKNVFWEAFLVTVIVFILGLLIGVAFETNRLGNVNDYYMASEALLMDSFALNNLADLNLSHCDVLKNSIFSFADKVYEESKIIDYYESSGKITDSLVFAHKRYDVLRTLLWIDAIKVKKKCNEQFLTVVYLYDYEPEDFNKKAEQIVWSKILSDLKQKKGDDLVLIPIASNMNITSLNVLISQYNVTSFPSVIIDEKYVVSDLGSVEDLEKYME